MTTIAKRAAAWESGLPVWWAIQDDLAAERGDPTLTELMHAAFDRVERLFAGKRPADNAQQQVDQ